MSSTLPKKWELSTFDEVCIPTEQVIPREDSEFFYIDISSVDRISKKIVSPQKITGKDAPSRARKSIKTGDVIVSMTRPNLNAVALVNNKYDGQIASTGFEVLRSNVMDSRWIGYLVRTNAFVESMTSLVQGALYPAIRGKDVRAYQIPVAPLAEQRRIADKLDTILTRVDAVQDRLARITPLLKRFRQSILAAATSGRLTEEWRTSQPVIEDAAQLLELLRKDHQEAGGFSRGNASEPTKEAHDLNEEDMPRNWVIATLQEICKPNRPITYGILKPGPELENGVPYIRVADFPGNKINLNNIKKTSFEIDEQYKRARLDTLDLLLSIRGSVGRLVIIPQELKNANITQDTARLSINERVSHLYIYYSIISENCQRRMRAAIRGVAVRGINIGDVRALQVPLPPFKEQTEIVRRVELLMGYADRLEARLQAAQTAAERLTPSLLAKAFRGELVPQDPSDESAGALLARLANQRAISWKENKVKRSHQPRAKRTIAKASTMTKSRQDEDVQGKPYLADHLRRIGEPCTVESLFKATELPVADFYKQLAWEIAESHVKDNKTTLEPGNATG